MDYVILGFVVLLLIFGIVAAIVGRTTWRAYHIVLAVFLLLTGLTYFYFAARTLQAQRNWQELVEQYKKEIARVQQETQSIVDGTVDGGDGDPVPLDELQAQANAAIADRGRVWQKSKAVFNPTSGLVTVTLPAADALLVPSTRVFAFSESTVEKGGQYLGEFVVAKASGKTVELQPAMSFDQRMKDRLAASAKDLWSLYEIMPNDSHEALTTLDDKRRAALLPPEVQQDYKRDGSEAKADDPEDRVWVRVKFTKPYKVVVGKETVNFVEEQEGTFDLKTADELVKQKRVAEVVKRIYRRPLRDYAHLLREANRQQEQAESALAEVTRQIKDVEEARVKLDKDIAASKQLIADLKSDHENFVRERDALTNYTKQLDTELNDTRDKLRVTLASIRANSNELAKLQLEALDRIDRIAPAP